MQFCVLINHPELRTDAWISQKRDTGESSGTENTQPSPVLTSIYFKTWQTAFLCHSIQKSSSDHKERKLQIYKCTEQ